MPAFTAMKAAAPISAYASSGVPVEPREAPEEVPSAMFLQTGPPEPSIGKNGAGALAVSRLHSLQTSCRQGRR